MGRFGLVDRVVRLGTYRPSLNLKSTKSEDKQLTQILSFFFKVEEAGFEPEAIYIAVQY